MSARDSKVINPISYALGVHSQIPECCVVFYSTHTTAYIKRLNARRGLLRGPEYVPCPKCWRRYARGKFGWPAIHHCTDSRDHPLCHYYLSGPDRVAGRPIAARYASSRVAAGGSEHGQ